MSDTYLAGNWESGNAMLQCEREECMTTDARGGRWWWREDLPYHASPKDAREAYDRHVATHQGSKAICENCTHSLNRHFHLEGCSIKGCSCATFPSRPGI